MELKPIQLSYEEHGQGTPLVLIHGFPLNRTIWYPLLPFLKDKARVILPDLRGFGQSPLPENGISMRLLAEDIAALLDSLSLARVVIAGHSMGGYASLAFAQAYPHRLAGLAMVTSQAAADTPERRQSRFIQAEVIQRKGMRAVVKDLASRLTHDPALQARLQALMIKNNPKAVIAALHGMAERPDATEWLTEIDVPAVAITGSQDILIPPERSRLMAQLLGRGWLVEHPDAAHMPMMEVPQVVADALIQLLAQVKI